MNCTNARPEQCDHQPLPRFPNVMKEEVGNDETSEKSFKEQSLASAEIRFSFLLLFKEI